MLCKHKKKDAKTVAKLVNFYETFEEYYEFDINEKIKSIITEFKDNTQETHSLSQRT